MPPKAALPRNSDHIGDRMKLHLRVRRVQGRDWRVLSLRPSTRAAFSSNHFHDTWHLLGDKRTARLLQHLLWGLAFQRHPRTVILLDRPHMTPTPFEADPALPVLLVNDALGTPDTRTCKALLKASRQGGSDRSVRWRSFGLEAEAPLERGWWRRQRLVERVQRMGGLIRWVGSPEALRMQARACGRLEPCTDWGSDYFPTERWEGEVQVFRDFHTRLIAAQVAAREIDAEVPRLSPEARQRQIWRRVDAVRRRGSRPAAG